MIIDCHVHINHYQDENVAALPDALGRLQTEMRRNRVDTALILTSYKVSPGRPSTREAVEATRGLTSLYVVAGIDFETVSPASLGELREFLQEGSVRGLKLYPGYQPFYPGDPRLEPVYRLAAEFQVPVMIHSGDTYTPRGKVKYAHPLQVDEVAVDHPEVNFVICHLGNPWMRDCMEVVYKNSNVYTDISGLVLGDFSDRFESFMQRQLQEMLLYGVEPDNVLYGTDWPISSMRSYLEFIDELKIPIKERRKIMFENAARLFRLPIKQDGPGLGSLLEHLK
ncbi:MAG TPA: amidohydrolase family protein [Gemmatimonadales bacterium]|nr:amidohydrolase family protein [Gemmatimonadales bacterium]